MDNENVNSKNFSIICEWDACDGLGCTSGTDVLFSSSDINEIKKEFEKVRKEAKENADKNGVFYDNGDMDFTVKTEMFYLSDERHAFVRCA